MKRLLTMRFAGALFAGVLLTAGSIAANAAQTAAGTSVSNTATVNYKVGTVAQTAVTSTATFKVDDKLVLTVAKVDSSIVTVSPGQTAAVLVYQVTNDGNGTQGVTFTTTAEGNGTASPFGTGTDSFDATTPTVFVSKSNTTTYDNVNDTASAIPQLAAGASQYVFVVATIPGTQADQSIAVNALTAQVAGPGANATYGTPPGANITADDSAAAWDSSAEQNIFADAAGTDDVAFDGKSSARDAFLVQSATLTVAKTSAVVSDPVCVVLSGGCGTTHPAHAIPGATMQYSIKVKNSGSTSAASLDVTDSLPAALSFVGPIEYNGGTCSSTAGSSPKCVFSSGTLEASSFSLPAATSVTISYEVKIH